MQLFCGLHRPDNMHLLPIKNHSMLYHKINTLKNSLSNRTSILVSPFFLMLLILNCQPAPDEDPLAAIIEQQLDSLLLDPSLTSVSMGIITADKVYTHHKGKLPNGQMPDDNTCYEIASITKTFTGLLLAHAIAEGKAEIDDDIRNYLEGSYPNLAYKDQPITFRHLVTHQSGLPHLFPEQKGLFDQPDWDQLPFDINRLQEGFTKEQFFEHLQSFQLDTLPGEQFTYSNAGANLLGYLLENIYDQPFEELLEGKILAPLQMDGTAIRLGQIDPSCLAQGQNVNRLKMPSRAEKGMMAEGGIISNVEDMVKYMALYLDTENPVVSVAKQELWNGKYGDFEAGLFWQIFKNGAQPDRIFQNGGAYGTSSWMTIIPERKIGIFLVTNTAGPDVHQNLSLTVDKLLSNVNLQ